MLRIQCSAEAWPLFSKLSYKARERIHARLDYLSRASAEPLQLVTLHMLDCVLVVELHAREQLAVVQQVTEIVLPAADTR
jgi:hypothetical protein